MMFYNMVKNNLASKMNNPFLVRIKSIAKRMVRNPLFYIMIGLVVIDLLTKWIIVWNKQSLTPPVAIIPNFLYVTLIYNTGAIFGIGNGQLWARVLIICIRLLLAIIIPAIYFYKERKVKTRYKVCILMIYAGCIGNLIDGLFYWENITGFNGVIDWLQFSFFGYIFNLADAYIVVAVFLLIVFLIVDELIEVRARNRRGEFSMTPEEYEKHLIEENKKKNGYTDKK